MNRWTGPRAQTAGALLLLVAACWFILLSNLEAQPMQVWDELRLANNAIEMAATGELIVTHHEGIPETWNTKPPLQIWLEALDVKLLGIRPLAFRLPSALAACATVLLLFGFARRRIGDPFSALLAGALLLTSSGFVLVHCARNGEYDAMLVLWLFASSLAFFRHVEALAEPRELPDRGTPARSDGDPGRWLWLTALFLVLAVYTKGIQGLLLLPAFLVYATVCGRLRAVLRRRSVLALGSVLLALAAYGILREQLQPGYLRAVWDNDLFGRYASVNEQHHGSVFKYVWTLRYWGVLTLLVTPVLILARRSREIGVGVFAIVMAGCYLAVISLSKTKLEWYLAPIFPFLALYIAFAVRVGFDRLRAAAAWLGVVFAVGVASVTAWFVLAMPAAIERHARPVTAADRYETQLAAFRESHPTTRRVVLGTPSGAWEAALYYRRYYAERGLGIEPRRPGRLELRPGETFLTSDAAIGRALHDAYWTRTIFRDGAMEGSVVIHDRASLQPG